MVPFGLSPEQFKAKFLVSLEKVSPCFIRKLKKLFTVSIPESVLGAEIQIFLGDDCMETPSAWIYYEGKHKKINSTDTSIFSGK